MNSADRKIDLARKLLGAVFTVVPLAAGADKFLHLIADWEMYLSPTVAGLLPVAPATFLRVAGVVEMAVGVAMMTRFARQAAWVAAAWLASIAVNILLSGMFLDVAVRDLALALAAAALALLTEARAARSASATP